MIDNADGGTPIGPAVVRPLRASNSVEKVGDPAFGDVTFGLAIRRLAHGDALAYREFRQGALARDPTAFTSTPDEERIKPLSWFEARISAAETPDDFVLGAFLGDDLVGTAGFSRSAPRQASHKGLLFGMAVAPEAAGRGVGRRLVLDLLEEARSIAGLCQVVLTYTEGNAAAERLYRRCGFEQFGREIRAVVVRDVEVTKIHMVRYLDREEERAVPLAGVRMATVTTDPQGTVSSETEFVFEQVGEIVSARYRGGAVVDGYLIGHLHDQALRFRYVQADRDGCLDAGVSDASLERLADGRLRLTEQFTWTTKPGSGTNVFEETRSLQ